MVIAPYKATGPEQLNLEKGQLIQVNRTFAISSWSGFLGLISWFLISFWLVFD